MHVFMTVFDSDRNAVQDELTGGMSEGAIRRCSCEILCGTVASGVKQKMRIWVPAGYTSA